MRVTSVGRPVRGSTIHSDSRKNPLRPGRFKPGDAEAVVRSTHLGYDCYVTGRINEGGKTRIILRAGRLPNHISVDVIAHLPSEMWWPARDHAACHALIDAVLQFDVASLRRFKDAYPEHEFGFESFAVFCDRRAAATRAAAPEPRVTQTVRQEPSQSTPSGSFPGALPQQLARWPSPVESTESLYTADYVGHLLKTSLVHFEDGDSALCVEVWGRVGETGRLLCSRAYVDMNTGEYEIRAHHPGRLHGLGLPLTLLHDHLGIHTRSRVRASLRSVKAAPPKSREPGPHSIMRNSRAVEGVISGDGTPFTEDRVATQRTAAGVVAPAPFEEEILSFPTAPG